MSETPVSNTEVLQTLVEYRDKLLETTEEWVSNPNSSRQLPIPKEVTQVVSQTHKEGGKVQCFYNPETCAQRCLQVLENAGGPIPKMTIVNKSNEGGEEEYLEKGHLIQHEGLSALLEQEPTILNYTSVIKALSQHKDGDETAKRVQDILARTIVM